RFYSVFDQLNIKFFKILGLRTTVNTQWKQGGQSAMEKRVDHLASRGPVVTLADGNFTRYTDGKSRPYSVVVLFTALGSQYKCTACR
ncbi:unnamed protein product, partial [Ectocarpus sp. 8 AP-2014]